ncbi:hypothetical protein FISHEDRAFT_54986 [Fistulina hepatica ATCC 64428]|uniref:N-acetyltransferase domain-containing protein n=1 Tax=Fistulina hepatica ATCC 64428 TaxID=1128425 RepID=A0A0D7APH7_9AGAR|nr:hypothetical protein FISHEDRAFT_54986 [Fistulina hepatica ATCC 64428]
MYAVPVQYPYAPPSPRAYVLPVSTYPYGPYASPTGSCPQLIMASPRPSMVMPRPSMSNPSSPIMAEFSRPSMSGTRPPISAPPFPLFVPHPSMLGARPSMSSLRPSTSTPRALATQDEIRLARLPDEIEDIADLAARAFVDDPLYNWLAGHRKHVAELSPREHAARAQGTRALKRSLIQAVHTAGGRITVVVLPNGRIVSAALWILPNTPAYDPKGRTRLFSVGIKGHKRFKHNYLPLVRASIKKEVRNGVGDDYWQLEDWFTDPSEQGKGYGSMLITSAIRDMSSDACLLAATNPRAVAVLEHFGWSVYDKVLLGAGDVGSNGLPTSRGRFLLAASGAALAVPSGKAVTMSTLDEHADGHRENNAGFVVSLMVKEPDHHVVDCRQRF